MQRSNWIPMDKNLVSELPKKRAYSEVEAAFCITCDFDNNKSASISGYATLWKWSWHKVDRFAKKAGFSITKGKPRALGKIIIDRSRIDEGNNLHFIRDPKWKKLRKNSKLNENDQQLQPEYSEIEGSTETQIPKRRTNGELEGRRNNEMQRVTANQRTTTSYPIETGNSSNKDSSSPSKDLSITDCKELTQGLAPVSQMPIEEPHSVPWDNLPGIQEQPLRIDSGHTTCCKEEPAPNREVDCRSFLEQAKDSPSRYPKPTGDFDEEEFKRDFGKNGEMELVEYDGLSSFDMATARRRGGKVKQVPCDKKQEVFGQHETEVLLDPVSGTELPIY